MTTNTERLLNSSGLLALLTGGAYLCGYYVHVDAFKLIGARPNLFMPDAPVILLTGIHFYIIPSWILIAVLILAPDWAKGIFDWLRSGSYRAWGVALAVALGGYYGARELAEQAGHHVSTAILESAPSVAVQTDEMVKLPENLKLLATGQHYFLFQSEDRIFHVDRSHIIAVSRKSRFE